MNKLDYQTRQATVSDLELTFRLKKLAGGEYIKKVFGWDEDLQLEMHKEQFTPANTVLIEKEGNEIGWISRFHYDDKIKIDEMYIIPEYQRKGIGSSLLGDTIMEAKRANLPIHLRVFKINPAVKLYQHHGFQIHDEDGPFYFMEFNKDEKLR